MNTPAEERLVTLIAESARGPRREGLFALWLMVRAAEGSAALVLSQLTAPAREVLGPEAGDAVTVAARTARLHL